MPAGTRNLVIDQGSDFSEQYTIRLATGALLPATGYSARAQMREEFTSASPSESFTTTFDSDGVITISLTFTETAALAAGKYKWDLEVFADDNSSVKRWLQGTVTVRAEVTK